MDICNILLHLLTQHDPTLYPRHTCVSALANWVMQHVGVSLNILCNSKCYDGGDMLPWPLHRDRCLCVSQHFCLFLVFNCYKNTQEASRHWLKKVSHIITIYGIMVGSVPLLIIPKLKHNLHSRHGYISHFG